MKYIRPLLCMLAVCFAFLLFTACSQKNIPQENVSQNEGFGGEIFYFLGSFIPSDARDADLITDEVSSETVSVEGIEEEVMFAQCKKVEENYKCRIVCQPGFGPYSTNAQFAAAYAAGIQQGDFISTDNNTLLDLYQSGLLVDLDSIEALNLEDTEKWGVYSLRTATTSRGVLYAIPMQGSRYMPIFKSYNGAFFYNSELYDTFDMDMTPKEMVEQGMWTFDNFYSVVTQTYVPDEGSPVYGLALYNSIVNATIYANGGDIITKKKGEYVFGYTQENAITALEWARKLSKTTGLIGTFGDFENGKAVFALAPSNMGIQSQIKTVSWVPFPYGPDVEQGTTYISYFGYSEGATAILKHEDDPENDQRTGVIFNALFEPTEKWGKDGYDQYIERNFFNSREDYDAYKAGSDHMHYDWSKEFSASGILRTLSASCDAMLVSSNAILPYLSAYSDAVEQIAEAELG